MLLDHSPRFPYSCYTEVRFVFDEPTSDWFVDQLRSDRTELAQLHVMGALVKKLKELGDLRILIPDQFVQSQTLECISESPHIQTLVQIDTRRLGQDTGRDILFDAGNQLTKIYEGWRKIVQLPRSEAP